MQRHLARRRSRHADGGGEIRPGRGRHDHLVTCSRRETDCDLNGLHAGSGREEPLGAERRAEEPAIEPVVIGGERAAEFDQPRLRHIEGLAAGECGSGGFAQESWRRLVAFPNPERNDAAAAEAVAHHFGNAACRCRRRFCAQPREPVRGRKS